MPSGSGKYLTKWFGIAVGIAIAFLCLLCLNLHTDRVPWGHSVEPLAVSEKNAGDRYVYEAYLPNAFDKKQTILFKTTHTRVSVKISGMEIYRYGFDESSPSFLKSPGTYWHLVQIPKHLYFSGVSHDRRGNKIHPAYRCYSAVDQLWKPRGLYSESDFADVSDHHDRCHHSLYRHSLPDFTYHRPDP